ncbi:MAG: hypothetical protein Q8O56_06250 [Solirubrobacteraceae bacterium]|nr:hypothetical protein [Solirubrobacteraceae bacterium]
MAATDVRVHPDAMLLIDHPDVLAEWRAARERIQLSGHPTCEEVDEETEGSAGKDGADGVNDQGADQENDDTGEGEDRVKSGDDWQAKARKHERALKRERAERAKLAKQLAEHEDAKKSEHDKALEEARREAREEALSEAQKERRADKLELAVTRLASEKGVKAGSGDNAKIVKFADSDDVHAWIERQIARGELDVEEIFTDDGRVDRDALATVLADLAGEKPHWLASNDGDKKRIAAGSSDAGRGGTTSVADMNALLRGGRT